MEEQVRLVCRMRRLSLVSRTTRIWRGGRILDTHMGSGSIAIACHYRGHPLTACEIDADYYAAAVERIQRETRQLSLFTDVPALAQTGRREILTKEESAK